MIIQKCKSRCHEVIMAAMLASVTLAGGGSALAESPPLPPVPERFVDNGPGNLLGINFRTYCRTRYNPDADQHIGPSGWWNDVSCKLKTTGPGNLVAIDLLHVCATLHPGSKPVNNTGSAYNWYCKK